VNSVCWYDGEDGFLFYISLRLNHLMHHAQSESLYEHVKKDPVDDINNLNEKRNHCLDLPALAG